MHCIVDLVNYVTVYPARIPALSKKKLPVPRMITPQPVGISIITPYATMCFIKYNWKTGRTR